MSYHRSRKKRKVMAEMNVVPYIDVMLVLLVIFMVTAPMMQTGVNINLPDADAKPLASDVSQGPLYIAIDENGAIAYEDGKHTYQQITTTELSTRVAGQLGRQGMRPVYIRADRNAAYDFIMQVMVAIQKAGAKKIGLMAEPHSTKTNP